MSSIDYLDLCRLCLVKESAFVPIFDGEGDGRQIFLKIAACLPVKVTRDDKLPKKICNECVQKIELFYQFCNTTTNAEKQLLEWIGGVDLNDKQTYVSAVINQDQSSNNRLDGNVMQQTNEQHQNNIDMNMMESIGLEMPMMIQQNQTQMTINYTNNTNAQSMQSNTAAQQQNNSKNMDDSDDDHCGGDDDMGQNEELSVKEEIHDSNRTIEPAFVNVSIPCEEAGPSGLQQKSGDIPDGQFLAGQSTDGDPKSGIQSSMEIEVKKEQQVWPLVHLDDLKKEIQDDTEESCVTQSINTELHQVKKELLNEAISIDVDDIYDCSYCGEIFNSELILSQHQAKSHPISSNDNNKIQDVKIEDIKLKDEPMNVDEPKLKSNLFDKVLSVVVERILECSYCGQIFYSNIKLTDHEAKCQSSLSNSDSPSSPIKQIQPDTLHSKTTELELSIKNENNTSIVSSQSTLDNIVPTSSKFPVNLPEKLQENIESIKLENVPQSSSSLSSIGVMNIQNLSSSSVETSLTSSINIDDNLIRDRKKVYNLREQIKKPDRLSDHITKDNQLKKVKVEELFDYSSDESTDSAKSIVVNNERAIIKLPSTSKEPEPVKFVRELICQFCNETFDCNNLRLNHIKNMHNLSLISCQLCPFETEWHVTFRKHIQMHQAKNIIPIITKCEICKRDLKSNRSLIYHKEIYHSDYTKKYVCEYDNCKYVSHSQKRVRDHYERWHTNKELLHCKVGTCKAAFNKQCNLNFHLLYKHPETISEPIFSCERCHKKFLSEPKYKKHIESHDNQNVNKAIFKCKLCPEEFPSDHFRKKHFFSKHKSSQYSCKQCDEKFKERQLLTEHMKERHTAPKVVKIFDCKDCGKILKTKSLLIKHSSIHSSEFFECDYCGYKAKLKELLVRHIVRLHTKKYNFKCKTPGCDKKYKLFIDYQWHIKKHHS